MTRPLNRVYTELPTTVFEVMSQLAREHNAINLGQGFPDDPGPEDVRRKAAEAVIDGNIATFKPPDTERCEITLVFLPGKLKVMQDGSDADCGFGHNVYATGTYEKIRGGKPKFEPPG